MADIAKDVACFVIQTVSTPTHHRTTTHLRNVLKVARSRCRRACRVPKVVVAWMSNRACRAITHCAHILNRHRDGETVPSCWMGCQKILGQRQVRHGDLTDLLLIVCREGGCKVLAEVVHYLEVDYCED